MELQDLLDSDGKYNPLNKWNGVLKEQNGGLTIVQPGCIVHLAQRYNTLGAEIDIAAQGTVIRKVPQGNVVTDKVKLSNCSAYGVATRNSDPTIGDRINSLARGGNSVSVANLVAVYMNAFKTSGFMLDTDGDGDNLQPVPDKTFTWVRGDVKKPMGLRLHVQIPNGVTGTGDNEGRQLTVSDLVDTSNSQNILYGAQFADYITMGVAGVGISGGQPAPAQFCPGQGPKASGGIHISSLAAAQAVEKPHIVVDGKAIMFKTRTSS